MSAMSRTRPPDGFAASRTRIASEGDQGWER